MKALMSVISTSAGVTAAEVVNTVDSQTVEQVTQIADAIPYGEIIKCIVQLVILVSGVWANRQIAKNKGGK